jgi:hypothetical protein
MHGISLEKSEAEIYRKFILFVGLTNQNPGY